MMRVGSHSLCCLVAVAFEGSCMLVQAITPIGTFALYAGICFVGFLFVIFCYPEVRLYQYNRECG